MDYSNLLEQFQSINEVSSDTAGSLLRHNVQDQTARTGLAMAGWKPAKNDMTAQAVEWWQWGKSGILDPGA